MQLIVDTKEQLPLEFIETDGVSIVKENLNVGDYTARHTDGSMSKWVIERKSIADLFGSFSANYDAERAKIIRAHTRELKYILAIEGCVFDVRQGYEYWKGGELHKVGKDGLSQLRQLMTISQKYGVEVHYFQDRTNMSFWIMEWFLAYERNL